MTTGFLDDNEEDQPRRADPTPQQGSGLLKPPTPPSRSKPIMSDDFFDKVGKRWKLLVFLGVFGLISLIAGCNSITTVPAGHVKVATLFGKVRAEVYTEGFHIVNPFYKMHEYDARQQSHKADRVGVPSQDQLTTMVDVSIQWRVNSTTVAVALAETGSVEQLVQVHLVPKLRSLMRETGKGVVKAEDYFTGEMQQQMQLQILTGLQEYCEPKGLTIQNVFLRNFELPAFIMAAIESKKQREQEAEKQKAELARYKIEQQQLVEQATAQAEAAEQEAKKVQTMADAKAYEITKINEAIAENPAYIQLMALKALEAISQSPASKIYFLNGDSPSPLPLMHLGEVKKD